MKQWNGLMKKEWLLMKEWFYGFVISVIISAVILTVGLMAVAIESSTKTAIVAITVIIWVLIILFLPLIILLNSLRKESGRPDVWLHSGESIFKLFGSKFVFASLGGLLSILLPAVSLFIYLVISGSTINEFTFTELVIFAGALFFLFFASSLLIASTGLFFAVLYQLIKPYVKGLAIPVLIVFFIVAAWLLERIKASSLFEKITSFGPIGDPSKEDFYIEKDGFFVGPTEPVIYTGNILITILSVMFLFVTAALLFEKKVRL